MKISDIAACLCGAMALIGMSSAGYMISLAERHPTITELHAVTIARGQIMVISSGVWAILAIACAVYSKR